MKAIIRKDEQAVSPVIATILMVAITVVLAAVLYVMVSGLIGGTNTQAKPTVILTASKTSTGADVLVSITPSTNPSNFKVNIENVGNHTFGTAVNLPTTNGGVSSTITVGTNTFTVTWQNPGGSASVSTGDHLVVKYTNGVPNTRTWSLLLIWSDGSTLTTSNWQS